MNTVRIAQLGILLGGLGTTLMLMGLFPGITGLPPTPGIGIVQIFMAVVGFSLLTLGALIYAKFTFYAFQESTLAQQIGVRLALTGIMLASLAGLADVLGFGSNPRTLTSDIFFGPWQAVGLIGGLAISSVGVLLYAVTGQPEVIEDRETPQRIHSEAIKNAEENSPAS